MAASATAHTTGPRDGLLDTDLVETMVSFANDHSIQVIAEGVEREEEYEAVKRLGVHLTQGFLFHDSRHAVEVEAHVG